MIPQTITWPATGTRLYPLNAEVQPEGILWKHNDTEQTLFALRLHNNSAIILTNLKVEKKVIRDWLTRHKIPHLHVGSIPDTRRPKYVTIPKGTQIPEEEKILENALASYNTMADGLLGTEMYKNYWVIIGKWLNLRGGPTYRQKRLLAAQITLMEHRFATDDPNSTDAEILKCIRPALDHLPGFELQPETLAILL